MIDDVRQDAEHRMQGALDALGRELAAVRTGRASASLVDRIQVEYYGTLTPLNQVAGISVPEARTIMIQPWERSTIPHIERALQKSDLGLTPNSDGVVIRLNIPTLTEDRRKTLVKTVKSRVEDGKVAVRNVRRDAVDSVKALLKDKQITEDDERRTHQELDTLTRRFTDEADRMGSVKEAEVLEV